MCATPVDAQTNAVTIPADALIRQWLAGDMFEYSCNGALVPANGQINTCTDNGPPIATWSVAATADLTPCSKCCNLMLLRYRKDV